MPALPRDHQDRVAGGDPRRRLGRRQVQQPGLGDLALAVGAIRSGAASGAAPPGVLGQMQTSLERRR